MSTFYLYYSSRLTGDEWLSLYTISMFHRARKFLVPHKISRVYAILLGKDCHV